MAATSPYSQNDYQTLSSFRPYQLPVNDIMKTFVAQNQFWDDGARAVNSVYDQALGLDLTNQQNREIRDNYLKDAEKELTKLSSMDLSDPDIQRKGIDLFKPLFRDEGIVSDDYATKHIKKVNSDALNYRNKDNGKFYSATNHKYALQGAEEFKNSTDRMAGKQYMQNAKEYEPFYDPSQELGTIMKYCKPDKASGQTISGLYNIGYTRETLSAMKVATCIDSALSDKARRQLQINASVTYKDNPEALRDQYIPYLQKVRSGRSQERAGVAAILNNKDNLKNLKPSELALLGIQNINDITPEVIESLQTRHDLLDMEIKNTDETVDKLMSGDFSPIQGDNFEPVAARIYAKDWVNNIGEGFSYDWQANTVKADPAAMLLEKERRADLRQDDDQQYDALALQYSTQAALEIERMRQEGRSSSGSTSKTKKEDNALSEWQNGMIPGFEQDQSFNKATPGETYNSLIDKQNKVTDEIVKLDKRLLTMMKSYGLPDDITNPSQPEFKIWLDKSMATNTDPGFMSVVGEFYQRRQILGVQQQSIRTMQNFANVESKGDPTLRDQILQQQKATYINTFVIPSLTDKDSPIRAKIAAMAMIPPEIANKIVIGRTDGLGHIEVDLSDSDITGDEKKRIEATLAKYGDRPEGELNKKVKGSDNTWLLNNVPEATVPGDTRLIEHLKPALQLMSDRAAQGVVQSTEYMWTPSKKWYKIEIAPGFDEGSVIYNIIDRTKPKSPVYTTSDRNQALGIFQTFMKKT